jgi:hypothetical protein
MAIDERAAREAEALLAQHYLDSAILARQVSARALEQALRDAEAGTLRDPAKTAMNAAITSGTLLDKRLILQERPTQLIGHTDPADTVNALARKLGIAVDTTATELPPVQTLPQPTTQPLLSAGESAKPRARTREKRRKPAAD